MIAVTLGAYASAPRPAPTGPAESAWYERLARIEGVDGLEVFATDSIHPEGPGRLAELLPGDWHLVVTMLPRAMAASAADGRYGLASDDPDGRAAAIGELRALLTQVHELDELLGRRAVRAVHVHSAPRPNPAAGASSAALAASLAEVASWDWGSTTIVLEHCDSLRADRAPVKGFLGLEAETAAVLDAVGPGSLRVGQSVNWGRSVIDGRSARTAVEHLAELAEAATLRGVVFSGASDVPGGPAGGGPDAHHPLRADDPASLMTEDAVRESFSALDAEAYGRLAFVGVKVQDPGDHEDVDARLVPAERVVRTVRALMEERR